ncbi:MAG: sigma-70 family RNA polymerase sigma factor [Planctomycetes bacterium]|nr:sigma-70 family RNA polymerase sigma factor [Planctomycetota bacterium]
MGGDRGTFLTTHWSLIEGVKQGQDPDRALIGLLLEMYWKPVYCYLRSKGYKNDQAKDLTQGFLHEVVLNRRLVERAHSSKGRFRSLLLQALNRYVVDEYRRETSRKCIPKDKLVPLDVDGASVLAEMTCKLDAEQSFNNAWKAELLERVLSEVKGNYVNRGMNTHWYVFRDRVLDPIMEDREASSLSQICARYDIVDEATASNMLKTVKRLFKSVLHRHVRQTVNSGEAVAAELGDIFKFFEKKSTE